MNRWQKFFDDQIKSPWSQFIKDINDIPSRDITDLSHTQEIFRLKKLATYLDNLINSIDADFFSFSNLQQINSDINNCRNLIANYNNNKTCIEESNDILDRIYNIINQNMPFFKGNARNISQSSRRYSEFIDKHIQKMKEQIIDLDKLLKEKEINLENIFNEIIDKKTRIDEFESEIFLDTDEEESLENKLRKYSISIQKFYEKLCEGNEENNSIILQIEEAKECILEKQKDIEKIESELDCFFESIFGKEDEIGERNGGHRAEFYKLKENVNQALNEHIDDYKKLEERINSLLPGATSAGLAASFSETRKSFDKKIKSSSLTFYFSIFFIILFGIPFKYFWDLFQNIPSQIPDSLNIFNMLALKLPILIPLVWLAIFSSKRRSENQRLQQEYAHKENLAKSYQSFKQQIDILPNESKEPLMEKLLDSAISAIGFNPSATLDGKHGDKPPIQEVFDKVMSSKTGKSMPS